MSGGIPYFSNPECVDTQTHETVHEGSTGRCRGLQFSGVSAMAISHGTGNNRVLISWSFKPTSQNTSSTKVFIYRGESPEDMILLNAVGISLDSSTIPEYLDVTANLLDFHKNYVYRVVAKEFDTSGNVRQTFSSWDFEIAGIEDKVSMYIISEHCFLYRHTSAGVPIMVFKKKHDGQTCPNCWDDVLQRVTKSNCLVCAGTGKLDGYYNPIEGWMGITSAPLSGQAGMTGVTQNTATKYDFTNYPLLRPGDIIVEMKTNNFLKVSDVRFPQRNGVLFLQTGMAEGINRSDVEYKAIQVPEDRRRELVAKLDKKIAEDSL